MKTKIMIYVCLSLLLCIGLLYVVQRKQMPTGLSRGEPDMEITAVHLRNENSFLLDASLFEEKELLNREDYRILMEETLSKLEQRENGEYERSDEEVPQRRVWYAILPPGAQCKDIYSDSGVEFLGHIDLYGFNGVILGLNDDGLLEDHGTDVELFHMPKIEPRDDEDKYDKKAWEISVANFSKKPSFLDFVEKCVNIESTESVVFKAIGPDPFPVPDPNGKYDYVIIMEKKPDPKIQADYKTCLMLLHFISKKETDFNILYNNYLSPTPFYFHTKKVALVDFSMINKTMLKSNAGKEVWNYLKAKYPIWGFKNVLLIGGFESIPAGSLYASSKSKSPVEADAWYGHYGNWDGDGDGRSGELDDDGTSMLNSNANVGRIPFTDYDKLNKALDAILCHSADYYIKNLAKKYFYVLFDKLISGKITNYEFSEFQGMFLFIIKYGIDTPRALLAGGICSIVKTNNTWQKADFVDAADYLDQIETEIMAVYQKNKHVDKNVRFYQRQSPIPFYWGINPRTNKHYVTEYGNPLLYISSLHYTNVEYSWCKNQPDHVILMGIASDKALSYIDLYWDSSNSTYAKKKPEDFIDMSQHDLFMFYRGAFANKGITASPTVQLWGYDNTLYLSQGPRVNNAIKLMETGIVPAVICNYSWPYATISKDDYISLFEYAYTFNTLFLPYIKYKPPIPAIGTPNRFPGMGEILSKARKLHYTNSKTKIPAKIPEEIWAINLYGDPDLFPYQGEMTITSNLVENAQLL